MTFRATAFPKLQTPKDAVIQLSKKRCFPLSFDKEHGKRAQTLFKSSLPHLYHSY